MSYEDYKVGWICALPLEMTAAIAMLDEYHPHLQRARGDDNTYVLGRIGEHRVAIASLPVGEVGTISAAQVAVQMLRTFRSIKFGLMVGIGSGVPNSKDVRLGDIVVGKPSDQNGGAFQYDLGRNRPNGFQTFGFLNAPPRVLRSAISTLIAWHDIPGQNKIPEYLSPMKNPKLPPDYAYPEQEPDELFRSDYVHGEDETCANCDRTNLVNRKTRISKDPVVHYGMIASGNQVMKNGVVRDEMALQHNNICFEMEAAGLMNTFPCVVIRGICDYADSHKSKRWQAYAAAAAAAYAKELLRFIPVDEVSSPRDITTTVSQEVTSSAHQNPELSLTHKNVERGQQAAISSEEQVRQLSPPTQSSVPIETSDSDSSASSFSVLTGELLNWDEVALGRLVLNLDDPGQDFYPHGSTELRPEEISVGPFKDARFVFDRPSGTGLIERAKNFLWPGNDQNMKAVDEISRTSVTYRLLNSGAVFERLLEDDSTRRWLEKFYRKTYIYSSVAIHVIVGPRINTEDNTSGIANTTETSSVVSGSLVPGDRVIGVRYRRLRFQRFSSKIDTASLQQKACWKMYDRSGNRGNELDSLKATFEDLLSPDELHEEYQFELCRSNYTGETYISLVQLPY